MIKCLNVQNKNTRNHESPACCFSWALTRSFNLIYSVILFLSACTRMPKVIIVISNQFPKGMCIPSHSIHTSWQQVWASNGPCPQVQEPDPCTSSTAAKALASVHQRRVWVNKAGARMGAWGRARKHRRECNSSERSSEKNLWRKNVRDSPDEREESRKMLKNQSLAAVSAFLYMLNRFNICLFKCPC